MTISEAMEIEIGDELCYVGSPDFNPRPMIAASRAFWHAPKAARPQKGAWAVRYLRGSSRVYMTPVSVVRFASEYRDLEEGEDPGV